MKSPLLAALAALQLATLGLVVGLLLQRNEPAANPDLERLTQALRGALNQERLIIQYLEEMRVVAAARAASTTSPATEELTPAGIQALPGDPPQTEAPADAASPFPGATAAIAELKRLDRHLRDEIKNGGQNQGPLKTEVKRRKDALIARGPEAIYVVRREVDLQPFESGRDPAFVEYLLDEVVPSLSSNAKDDAFDIARSALVRATNEAPIKFAAARALQSIDSNRWVKEVCDVIALGGSNEIGLRARLLGLFETAPRPEAVELCKRFLEDARQPSELRTRAIVVLARQDSSAVIPILRKVLFEDSAAILKISALDVLWDLMKTPDEKRALAEKVVNEDPARMPAAVQDKARNFLKTLD